MAKKSAKKQPKQPNVANVGDTETAQSITTSPVTSTTANQPTTTSQVDSHAPATTFFDFITLATTEDVKKFLNIASTTPEGKNLEYIWRRAHGEGYKKGRKSLLQNLKKKMEDKFDEGVERGMDLGREEGYTVAKEAFDDLVNKIKAREARKTPTSDFSTQTDPTATETSYSTSGTQTNTLHTIWQPTMDVYGQTNPICAQTSCHIINLPLPSSTPISGTSSVSTTTIGTQTKTRTSQDLKIGVHTHVSTSRLPVLPGNRKTSKMGSTSEISPNINIFSSPTPSPASSNLTTPSTITTAPQTQSKSTDVTKKHENDKKSPVITKITSKILTPSIVEPTNDVTQVYASQPTQNDAVPSPLTLCTGTSSAEDPQPPAVTIHPKSYQSRADFESRPSTESPAPTPIVTALETLSTSTDFTKNSQKVEKLQIFNPEPPKLPVSEWFKWADDVESVPMTSKTPTKCTRDFSALRSSTKNPFSSLHRRRRNRKHPRHFINFWSKSNCHHSIPNCHHSPTAYYPPPHHLPQPPLVSLDWDKDPRLADLSNALHALGWVRC